MEIDVFLALTGAGIPEGAARSATEAIRKEMVVGIREVQKELATKDDLNLLRQEVEEKLEHMEARMEAKMASKIDLDKAKGEILQVMEEKFSAHLRWTFGSICGGFAILGGVVNLYRLLP